MNIFRQMYKILKALERALADEAFTLSEIDYEALGLSEKYWTEIMIILAKNGFVEGVCVLSALSCDDYVKLTRPKITLKGLEYLEENSIMRKAANVAKDIAGVIR